jgi:class 3 adenylate cyclase/tetratricopeptide (TPR) repeat protein
VNRGQEEARVPADVLDEPDATTLLDVYIPRDRRRALVEQRDLHDRTSGAVLFADMSGFTRKTEELADLLGAQRGAEALRTQVDAALGAVIEEVHRYGGSIIGFAGDAVTAWFDGDDGRAATAAALASQRRFGASAGGPQLKFAVTAGLARRFLVGHARIQRMDVVAGEILDRMAAAEKLAHSGEVLIGSEVVGRIQQALEIVEWRHGDAGTTSESFAVVTGTPEALADIAEPQPLLPVPRDVARDFLLPPVHQRLERGNGELATEMRRVVTLFAQFGGIDYDLDNEAGEKLDGYIKWVQTVLARYGAFLVSLVVGDKGAYFYAAFGAPLAHEDDVTRALRAAKDLVEVPDDLDFIDGVSIGISEGRMLAGTYGGRDRRTYGVLGLAANVSARFMQRARSGQILVSDAISAEASDRYDFHRLSGDPIPGTGGAQVLEVGPAKPEHHAVAPKSRIRTEMVGRTAERDRLHERLQALLDGESDLLVIEGPAGIGKSRLLVDFIEQANALAVPTFTGVASDVERNTPLYAWRTVFQDLLGLEGTEDEAAVIAAVEALLADAPELWERLPLLNPVLPLDLAETEITARIAIDARADNALEVMLACLEQPVGGLAVKLLVFDDCQWLDSASWSLIEATRRRIPSVLIALARRPVDGPEALDKIPMSLRDELDARAAELIRLEPLDDDELMELIELHLRVPKVPHEVREVIAARSEGNPFFAQELVESLLQRGLVSVDDFTLTVHGGVEQLQAEFPERVERLLVSRLDRLSLTDQMTLVVGSVLGRSFSRRMLADVGPGETGKDELSASLENLVDLGFLDETTFGEDPSYQFRHGLTQRAAADLLPPARRTEIHARAAGWIEAHQQALLPTWYPALAQHWDAAGNVPKALQYLELAAAQAAATSAFDEAIAFYSRALTLGESGGRGDDLARWHVRLGEVYVHRQREDTTEGRRHLEEGLRGLGARPPRGSVGAVFGLVWQFLVQLRNRWISPRRASAERAKVLREASRAYERLVELYYLAGETPLSLYAALRTLNLAEAAGPSPEWTRGMATVGALVGFIPMRRSAERYLERSLNSVDADEPSAEVWAALAAGFYYTGLGDWARATALIERVHSLAAEMGDERRTDDALQNLMMQAYLRGDIGESLRTAGEVVERGERRGSDLLVAYGIVSRVYAMLELADFDEAVKALRLLQDIQDRDPDFPDRALIDDRYGLRALAELGAGRARSAVDFSDQLMARKSGAPDNYSAIASFTAPAEVYLSVWRDQGVADRALRRKARRAMRRLNSYARVFPIGRAWVLRWQAVHDQLSGNSPRARRNAEASIAQARELGMRLDEARGLETLAWILGPDEPDADRHASDAASIRQELGISPPELEAA